MPRYAWDDGGIVEVDCRARSCDAAVATPPCSVTAAKSAGDANVDKARRSCPHSTPAQCRSLLLCDPAERPALLGDSSQTPPSPSPALLRRCPVTRADGGMPMPSAANVGQVAASGVVASTAGLVLELQQSTNHLLAELEQRDSEVRVLRQALADLARDSDSFKPSLRSLLNSASVEVKELDSQQQAQLQSIKRSLRDKQVRNRERRSSGTPTTSMSEASASAELRAELHEALAKLAEGAAREKKLCEELEQLRKISLHSHSRRRSAELDLERCRMGMEDQMARHFQQAVVPGIAPHGRGICPKQRSLSRGSTGSRRGRPVGATPPHTPPMPSRLSTCSSSGAPPTPQAQMRASSRDALLQAESLVLQMFDLPGARSPNAASRSPTSGRKAGVSRSPHNKLRACATQTDAVEQASVEAAGAAVPPPLPLRSPGGEAHSKRQQSASHSPKQKLRAINGCMPRFPSAELGSPKPALGGDRHEEGALRRRSCPQLRESQPQQEQANATNCAVPAGRSSTGSAAHAAPATTSSDLSSSFAADNLIDDQRPSISPGFQLDPHAIINLGQRRRDEPTPASPALVQDDYLGKMARTIVARMSGSPEPSDSEEPTYVQRRRSSAEATEEFGRDLGRPRPVTKSRLPPSRFTPVELPATRLSSVSSHWMQHHKNAKEIHRNWGSPLRCSIELS